MSGVTGRWLGVALGISIAAGCARPHYVINPQPRTTAIDPAPSRLTDHVLLVSIDGLRPDAISRYNAATLQRLISEGSFTLAAQTILPSKTLPSHTSMLTGEPPDRHGILWNNAMKDRPGTIEIPTVFSVARTAGYATAAFFSKAKFSHLQRPGTLDYSQAPGGWWGKWSASRTAGDVEKYLATASPNLLFVHLPDPDSAGHSNGWMTADYGRAVQRADAAVARLIAAAEKAWGAGAYTVIITADHGGHNRDHGSDNPLDVNIPWIAWGRGVTPGEIKPGTVHTMDTASTVLYLLGLQSPAGWAGTPVIGAFAVAASGGASQQ